MKSDDHIDPLSTELEEALRGLGRAEAPLELRARVELELFGSAQAPRQLREQVFAELREAGDLNAAPQKTRPAAILRFQRLVPVAVAAALLIGFTMFGPGQGAASKHPSQQELDAYTALRAEVKQMGTVIRVPAEELSPAARSLAAGFGVLLDTEGAE